MTVQIESRAKVSGLALKNDAPRFRLTVPSGELRVEDCVPDTQCSFLLPRRLHRCVETEVSGRIRNRVLLPVARTAPSPIQFRIGLL